MGCAKDLASLSITDVNHFTALPGPVVTASIATVPAFATILPVIPTLTPAPGLVIDLEVEGVQQQASAEFVTTSSAPEVMELDTTSFMVSQSFWTRNGHQAKQTFCHSHH